MVENLIVKLCKEEQDKLLCAKRGLLDALAFKLSTFVVRQGFVMPGAETRAQNMGALGTIPEPASNRAKLGPLLRAICVLIDGSRPRADYLLSSPALVTVFPPVLTRLQRTRHTAWEARETPKPLLNSTSALDTLLPQMHFQRPMQILFPSLADSRSSFARLNTNRSYEMFARPDLKETSQESALVPWLVCISREELGITRSNAIRLIAILFQLRCAKATRIPTFASLLLPLLVNMMKNPADEDIGDEDDFETASSIPFPSRLPHDAAATVAALVKDSPELQNRAVTLGAISQIVLGLQTSFVPLPTVCTKHWDPKKHNSIDSLQARPQDSETGLGPPGLSPLLEFRMRTREKYLLALMSFALYHDDHRKAICDKNAVSMILQGLKPYNLSSEPDISQNSTPTIVAACGALRALTRSPFVIAVVLKDFETCKGVFELLTHPDVCVQKAAIQVVVNLSCDYCRVRSVSSAQNLYNHMLLCVMTHADFIKNPGFSRYIPLLCENIRSPNIRLQTEAMWALGNIAYQSELDTKMQLWQSAQADCVKSIISQDPRSPITHGPSGEPLGSRKSYPMATPNAVGQHVELLNPADMASIDHMTDNQGGEAMTSASISNVRMKTLEASEDVEYIKETRKSRTLLVQKALDFIRNLICGPSAAETLEKILADIGSDQLFAILLDRIHPWSIDIAPGGEPPSMQCVMADDQVVISTTSIFVHFAICSQHFADALLAQRKVMEFFLTLFSHHHEDVRRNCVWVVINCLAALREEDMPVCRQRAHKLQELQICAILEHIGEHDKNVDVRERSKVAKRSLDRLLAG